MLISQWLLSIVRPELMLPRWIPSQGALVGWWFIAVVRALFRPGQPTESPLDFPDDFPRKTGTRLLMGAILVRIRRQQRTRNHASAYQALDSGPG
jgi:hypothetical protein